MNTIVRRQIGSDRRAVELGVLGILLIGIAAGATLISSPVARSVLVSACALGVVAFGASKSNQEVKERETARRILREEDRRFDAFMTNCPLTVFIKDEDRRLVYINPAGERMWSFSTAQWLGKTDLELWPRKFAERLRADDLAVLRSDSPAERSMDLPHSDGSLRQLLTVTFPFTADGGKPFLGSFAQDVTAHRALETALRASEELNQRILNSSLDSIKILTLNGAILSMNGTAMALLGVGDPRRMLNRDWADLLEGSDREAARRALTLARTSGTAEFERRARAFNGEEQWWHVLVSPIPDERGEPKRLLVVSRNVTKVKAELQRARESESRYRELFENNPLPAWIYDTATMRFLDANRKARETYGYSLEEFRAMTVADIRIGNENGAIEADLASEAGQGVLSGPWRHRFRDGSIRIVEAVTQDIDWFAAPARLTMVHDITERVESEEKFRVVFEESSNAHLLADETLQIVDCNRAAVRMLRVRSKDDVIGQRPSDGFPERMPNGQSREEFIATRYAELMAAGSCSFDCEQRRPDGTTFPVENTATRVRINHRPLILIEWNDLTEQRRAQAALLESEARLRETQQIARLGSWETVPATGEVWWSSELYEILGVQPGSGPLGIEEFLKRIHPEDRDAVRETTLATLERGARYDMEYRFIRGDGDTRYIHSRARLAKNGDGAQLLRGSLMDVTEDRAGLEPAG